jgi:hypothetical protein
LRHRSTKRLANLLASTAHVAFAGGERHAVPLGSVYVSEGVQFTLTETEGNKYKYKYEATNGSTGTLLCPTPEFGFFVLQPQAPTQLPLAEPKTLLATTILAQAADGKLVGFRYIFKESGASPIPVTFAVESVASD